MKYIYTEKDLELLSWDRIDKLIDKIYSDVNNYIKQNNLKIKFISPILRGGGVPAIKLSHMFNVIDMLPIQLKYNSITKNRDIKLGLDYLNNCYLGENECILLVGGNHCTGATANVAINILREKFGSDVKIIYVALSKDYTNRNSAKNVIYSTCGMLTNETKQLSKDECDDLCINYNLVTVYPWENVEEELFELNSYGECFYERNV